MGHNHKVIEARRLTVALHDTLLSVGENNWINGVRLMITHLDSEDGLNEAASIFRTMNAGMGSFGDYVYWSDNIDDRKQVNRNIEKIKGELFSIFDAPQDF